MILRVLGLWLLLAAFVMGMRAGAIHFGESLMLSHGTVRYEGGTELSTVHLVDVGRGFDLPFLEMARSARINAWLPGRNQFVYVAAGQVRLFDLATLRDTRLLAGVAVNDLAASPDGDCFAFTAEGDVWLHCISAGETRTVSLGGEIEAIDLDWSQTDRLIISAVQRTFVTYDLYVMNPDTLDSFQMTSDGIAKFDPTFMPDGESVIYATFRQDVPRLAMLELGTGVQTQLPAGFGEISNPAVSPDGRYVAFVSSSAYLVRGVFLLDMETRLVEQVTPLSDDVIAPAWVR